MMVFDWQLLKSVEILLLFEQLSGKKCQNEKMLIRILFERQYWLILLLLKNQMNYKNLKRLVFHYHESNDLLKDISG
jgi:hypothetical protein